MLYGRRWFLNVLEDTEADSKFSLLLFSSQYCFLKGMFDVVYFGLSPFPVIVTTRIITFLVGNPYNPSVPLLLGRGTTQSILIYKIQSWKGLNVWKHRPFETLQSLTKVH